MTDTIDAAQCAELLRCTVETAEEMARKGEIPALKIGRGWIFVRADLLQFLAERARQEAEERRQSIRARKQTNPALQPVKSKRQQPPALPQPPTVWPQGLQPGN